MEWRGRVRGPFAALALTSVGAAAGAGCCEGAVTLAADGPRPVRVATRDLVPPSQLAALDAATAHLLRPVPPAVPGRVSATDDGFARACRALSADIARASPRLVVLTRSHGMRLAAPCTLDFAWGDEGSATLVMVRVVVSGDGASCERLTWTGDGGSAGVRRAGLPAAAERARLPAAGAQTLVDLVRALSATEVYASGWPAKYAAYEEFVVLVRVCGPPGGPDRVWEYSDSPGGRKEHAYAAPKAVIARARDVLGPLAWTSVPEEEFRRTHFSDAFARNRGLYVNGPRRWGFAASLGALGAFGDETTLPSVRWIEERLWEPAEREELRIRRVLEQPQLYLAGGPRVIPEQ